MPKVWDDLLEEYERQGKIIRIEITVPCDKEGYGDFAFTTPKIREYIAKQRPFPLREPWGGVNEPFYFTIKDQMVVYAGHKKDQAPVGFGISFYSLEDELRGRVWSKFLPGVIRLFTFNPESDDPDSTTSAFWRVWKKEPSLESVKRFLDEVVPLIERTLQ